MLANALLTAQLISPTEICHLPPKSGPIGPFGPQGQFSADLGPLLRAGFARVGKKRPARLVLIKALFLGSRAGRAFRVAFRHKGASGAVDGHPIASGGSDTRRKAFG